METCKQIQVIETTLNREISIITGEPTRLVTQYWSLEGELLAEVDSFKQSKLESYSTNVLMAELIKRGNVTHCLVDRDEQIYGQYFDTDGHVNNNAKKIQINGPAHILVIN